MSVESTFLLIDRASGPIRSIRRELRGLQRDAVTAGRALDGVGGPKAARDLEELAGRTRTVRGDMQDLSRDVRPAERALADLDRTVVRSTGNVRRAGREVELLRGRTKALGAAAVVALPAIEALGGATVALAGSLSGAGAAVGVVGAGGAGTLVAGLAGVVSVAKPANAAIKQATTAQKAYTKAVQEHGRWSREAVQAQHALDRAFRDRPGLKRATREMRAFGREWRQLTAPGRRDYFGLLGDVAQVGRRAAPRVAGSANRSTRAVRRAGTAQARFLAGDFSMDTFDTFSRAFARELPAVERTLENIEVTVGRVSREAIPFFEQGVHWAEQTTMGWRESSRNVIDMRRAMRGYMDDLRTWGDLTHSTFKLAKDVLSGGRPAGRSALESLTDTLDRWDAWVQKNPEKVDVFFRNAIDDTRKLGRGLSSITHALHELSQDLRPLIPMFERLGEATSLVAGAGPGSLAIALGAARGFRGAGGGAGMGGAGFGGAAAGAAAMGGAGRVGPGILEFGATGAAALLGATAPGSMARAASLRAAAFRSYVGGLGPAVGPTSRMYGVTGGLMGPARRAGTAVGPVRTPFVGNPGGARLAGPVSQLGERAGAGRLMAAAKGAGGKALPLAALFGFLDANSFDGRLPQKLQAGTSTLADVMSFGLASKALGGLGGPFERPQSRTQLDAKAKGVFEKTRGTLSKGRTVEDLSGDISRLMTARRTLRSRDIDLGSGKERDKRLADLAAEFSKEIDIRRGMRKELQLAKEADSNARSRAHASAMLPDIGKAYDVRAQSKGAEAAMDETVSTVLRKLRSMKPAGARIIGENMLAWGQAQAKANPALQGQVDRLTHGIERRFSSTGEVVKVVNGRIVTNSKAQWSAISKAIGTEAERAREEASSAFTKLQHDAMAALTLMGFSPAEAKSTLQGVESVRRQNPSLSGPAAANIARGQAASGARYSEQSGSRDPHRTASSVGGTGDGIGSPTAPAGRASAGAGAGLMGAKPALQGYADKAATFGLHVSSGRRPGAITSSGNVSYHSSGDALDLAGPPAQMMAFAKYAADTWGSHLEELIYTPFGSGQIKNGQHFVYTGQVAADHYDHVHIADTAPTGGGGPAGGAGMAGPAPQLDIPTSRLRGVPGALSQRAMDAFGGALNAKLASLAGGGDLGADMPSVGGGRVSAGGTYDKAELMSLWRSVGGAPGSANIAAAIALAESSGNPNSENSIGATGLWQILRSAHPDWDRGGNLKDPVWNAKAAVGISSNGRNWTPWTTYTGADTPGHEKTYLRFMGDGMGRERTRPAQHRVRASYLSDGAAASAVAHRVAQSPPASAPGASLTSTAGVFHVSPQITVHASDRATLRKHFSDLADELAGMIEAELDGGPEESTAGLM